MLTWSTACLLPGHVAYSSHTKCTRCVSCWQAAARAGLVANSSTEAAAADVEDAAAGSAAAVPLAVAAAGEAGVAAAVHQRLLAAACVQKQLAQQAAEFKRKFGEHVLLQLLCVVVGAGCGSLLKRCMPHLHLHACVLAGLLGAHLLRCCSSAQHKQQLQRPAQHPQVAVNAES